MALLLQAQASQGKKQGNLGGHGGDNSVRESQQRALQRARAQCGGGVEMHLRYGQPSHVLAEAPPCADGGAYAPPHPEWPGGHCVESTAWAAAGLDGSGPGQRNTSDTPPGQEGKERGEPQWPMGMQWRWTLGSSPLSTASSATRSRASVPNSIILKSPT